jgi:hypothetical protein
MVAEAEIQPSCETRSKQNPYHSYENGPLAVRTVGSSWSARATRPEWAPRTARVTGTVRATGTCRWVGTTWTERSSRPIGAARRPRGRRRGGRRSTERIDRSAPSLVRDLADRRVPLTVRPL